MFSIYMVPKHHRLDLFVGYLLYTWYISCILSGSAQGETHDHSQLLADLPTYRRGMRWTFDFQGL